jgi:hypothetical protein
MPFDIPAQERVNSVQRIFKKLSLVLLWTFLAAPSAAMGTEIHVATLRPELAANTEEEAILRGLMEGRSVRDCMTIFYHLRDQATQAHFLAISEWTKKAGLERDVGAELKASFFHVKEARSDTYEFHTLAVLASQRLSALDRSIG